MNFGDCQNRNLSSNYHSNPWNDDIYYTGDVERSHQYFNDSVCYREDDVGKCNVETKQMFSKFPNSLEPVDHFTANPLVASLGHFQNQNIPTAKDQNWFEDFMRLQQNSSTSSMQFSEQISLGEYSKQSLSTYFQNQYNNCCDELAKFNILQNQNEVKPFCFDSQSSGENDFYSAQRVGMQSYSYEESISNVHSWLYGHKPCDSGINSEQDFGQSYIKNNCNPFYENSTKIQHNIRPSKKPIVREGEESNFNLHPRLQMDKNETMASTFVDPNSHHWYVLGIGTMRMECWEVIVFYRNHSVYVNTGLIAQSIGLSTLLVRRLVGIDAIMERMTQFEVSILKYIKCLSAKAHDTGLIPLAYFLNTMYSKLSKNKPNQSHIKSIIKCFIDKLQSGFVPPISNIPYDLSSFIRFNKTPIRQGSDNSLKQFKIASHLVVKNKSFSLIEHDGDYYMHLGEMVSNGLFPSVNLVRRKIRKMRLQTKWLDSAESKYLNLSQEQELIRFSDLRILCGLILYLHPAMKTDLLQMFSVMDLPDKISATINHLEPITNPQNYLPNNQNQFLWVDPPQTSPTMIGGYPQMDVISAPCMKNMQSVNFNVQMESLDLNYDPEIRNDNPSPIMKENVFSIAVREKSVSQDEKIEPSTSLQLGEPIFIDSVINSKAKTDILDVAYQELLDGTTDICINSAIASSQILPKSDESTNRDNCMTPKTSWPNLNEGGFPYNKHDKHFDSSLTSENFQMNKGNDKFNNYYINQNCNYFEEFIESESVFQIPEVSQKISSFNNNCTPDKVSQMEQRQVIDLTVHTPVPVSSNSFGNPRIAEHSKTETFAHLTIGTSPDNRLGKKQNDPEKGSRFLNISKSLDGSYINPFKSKCSAFDQNQLSQNTSIRSDSNDDKSKISTSLVISNSNQVCTFSNMAHEDKSLYAMPTRNSEQNGTRSFEEQEKNSSLTAPSSKRRCFTSKYSQGRILRNQDGTLQDDFLPSMTPWEMDQVASHSSESANNCLWSLSDGQIPMCNTPFQSLQINGFSFQPMPGSLEKSENISYPTTLSSGNESLNYNKSTSSDSESCNDGTIESVLMFSGNLQKNVPVVENLTSTQITSCSETLIPVKNNPLLVTSKENGSSLFTDRNNCELNKEFSTSSRFSEDCSKMLKRTTLATIPNAIITSLSSTNSISSPTITFRQCTPRSPGVPQTKQSISKPAKNLDQFTRDENMPKNKEIALSSQTAKSGTTVEKSQTAKSGTTVEKSQTAKSGTTVEKSQTAKSGTTVEKSQTAKSGTTVEKSQTAKSGTTVEKSQIHRQIISQPNEPCMTSTAIQRSYKEQALGKLLNEKSVETDDQKELRSSQATSNMQNHILEIASLAAIKKFGLETNQDASRDSVSQNGKTNGNCRLTLPCFEMVDPCIVFLKEINNSSESTGKDSKSDSTNTSVQFNSANQEEFTELANLNKQNSSSLISNITATKEHNSLSNANSQFSKEILDRICFNKQSYVNSVASHKQDKMEPDVIASCMKKVVEKKGQLVGTNTTRLKNFKGQKSLVQNKDNYRFSLGKRKSVALNNENSTESAVLDKYEKQFDSRSQKTIGTGSLKYAGSSAETKAPKMCEPDNLDILSSCPNYQATTVKPITVLDLVNIIKLNPTGNRLHLDVAITDQARRIFENKTKDNPVPPEKIFLQELANDCCQFAKYWFSLHGAKKTLDSESRNCASSIVIGSNLKTQTVLPFQKNKYTNNGYEYNTRESSEIPPISDPAIISCKCSRKVCNVLEIPENETPKKHRMDLRGKNSQTHNVFHDVMEESSSRSRWSNFVSFKRAKRQHDQCNDSSKFCQVECIEQIPQKRAKYFEFGFRRKSKKRKIPYFKTKQSKKTKY